MKILFFEIFILLCVAIHKGSATKYTVTNPGPTLEFMNLLKKCTDYLGTGEITKINLLASEKEQDFLDSLDQSDKAVYVFVWSPTSFTVDEYEKRNQELIDYINGRVSQSKIDMYPLFVGQASSVRARMSKHLSLRASGKVGAFSKEDKETRLAIDEPNKRVYFDQILSQIFMTRVELSTLEEARMTEQFLLYVFTLPCNIVSSACKLTVFDRKDINNRNIIMNEYNTVRNSIKSIYTYVRLFPQVAPYRDFFDSLFR
ncbi:uncharacterized protein LOC130625716 [Hydractinia symbiolongicarpus]|uniref:uncharacterized protein LOC130625716 n=1 Tax=Hydractinia symbiolongicarpus TaxID=13093 RepID=UPI00254BD719|nr:uncharacterized protein LOC130625716 [Hydractinia symbiolongicarpus]